MSLFEIILFFVIIPVVLAFLGFPIGAYVCVFGRQKENCLDLEKEKSSFDFSEICREQGKDYSLNFVEIKAFDKIRLVGEEHSQNSDKTVLFFHGFHSNPRRDFKGTAERFFKEGYNVVCCYQRAHCVSGGRMVGCGQLEQYDILSWVDWASKRAQNLVVYGLSMGGAGVGFSSDKIKNEKVKALVIDCAFSSYREIILHSDGQKAKATVKKIMFKFAVACFCLFSKILKGINIKKRVGTSLKENKIPTVFITGKADVTTPVSQTILNFESNASKKILILVEDAPHGRAFPFSEETQKKEIFAFLDECQQGEKDE